MDIGTPVAEVAPVPVKPYAGWLPGQSPKKALAQVGVRIIGWVCGVGHLSCPALDPETITLEKVEATPARCPHPETAQKMISLIDSVRLDCDSIGGTATFAALGVPPGWGEPVFDKLKADLAKAMLSLPAVTAFEYGSGFSASRMRGSEHNDLFVPRPDRPWGLGTEQNNHGGMLGGISSGENILTRVAIKPTSSISRPQKNGGSATESRGNPREGQTRPLPASKIYSHGGSHGGHRPDGSLPEAQGPVRLNPFR